MANNTKRNAKGGGTIRKRADGRWEARFSIGFDPKTGKQIQKSVYGQTQKEVRQKLSAALTELDSGTYITPTSMKLGRMARSMAASLYRQRQTGYQRRL